MPAAACPQSQPDEDELIVRLFPLVQKVAHAIRRYLPPHAGVEMDDLVGSGVLGLIHAVRRFDARRCAEIERYASIRIRGAILDSLRGLDTMSRSARKLRRKVEQTRRMLESQLNHGVTLSDVVDALEVAPNQRQKMVQYYQAAGNDWRCPQGPANPGNGDSRQGPEAAADGESPFEVYWRTERQAIMTKALSTLSDRDREILSMYYQRNLTQKQIGEQFNVCEARISQLHGVALSHLRRSLLEIVGSPRHIL